MNDLAPSDLITEHDAHHVRTITLGRPPAHPLSRAMVAALHAALDRAAEDPAVNVVVLDGPGHIFCAGHDMKEIKRHRADPDQGAAFLTELFEACAAMMIRLATLPKPTIAQVDGIATAAGLQMAASCDLVFASDRATFQLPGVQNGGHCTTPSVAVGRCIAPKHLMDLTLSGEAKDARWAFATGLVSRVIAAKDLAAETQAFACGLAARNPGPLSAGKAAVRAHLALPLNEAYALATPVMISHFMDPGRRVIEERNKF